LKNSIVIDHVREFNWGDYMKKIWVLFVTTIFMILTLFGVTHAEQLDENQFTCPKIEDLVKISSKSEWEIRKVLNIIIPQTFKGSEYKKWEVIKIKPLLHSKNYYEMGKTLCGKEVSERTWLVQMNFPKLTIGGTKGYLLLAKNNENGWFVWYRHLFGNR
jgi:hypothetical protein